MSKQRESWGCELEQRTVSEQGWAGGTVHERVHWLYKHSGTSSSTAFRQSEVRRIMGIIILCFWAISRLLSCYKTNNNITHLLWSTMWSLVRKVTLHKWLMHFVLCIYEESTKEGPSSSGRLSAACCELSKPGCCWLVWLLQATARHAVRQVSWGSLST